MTARTRPLAWGLDLRRGKLHEGKGLYFVEGRKAVGEALASGVAIVQAFLARDAADMDELLASLHRRGVPVTMVTPRDIERLSHTRTPQGIVLVAERPVVDEGELVARRDARVVYLDAVQDPGNVGAIVRAAAALGATHVVAGGPSADPFSPKAARAAAGGLLRIAVLRDPQAAIPARLKAHGYDVIAAEARGSERLGDERPHPPWLLLLGAEGSGVSAPLRALARVHVSIPIAEGAESLNVAQAAAVLLHHFRQ